MYSIETKNLSKVYSGKVVVDSLNLSVRKGTIFGFLGKNGAGKSTFINMITGIIKPTSGEFKINHTLNKIGVLPDYSTFYDNFNATQHLKFFSEVMGINFKKEEAEKLLIKVGLGDDLKKRVKNYSFGMKKKLGIAQALLNNPEVIFLDEPTSGVDPNSILNIHNIIKEIAKNGTTVFLTSHNLDEIEKLCDEIAIMENGKIKISGLLSSIKKNFNKEVEVKIKITEIDNFLQEKIRNLLKGIAKSISISTSEVTLKLDSEEEIPIVNEILVKNNVHLYSINTYKPSLEEIFMNLN